MTSLDRDNAGVRFPPPLIYLIALLAGFAAEPLVGLRTFGMDRWLLVGAGVALLLAGFAVAQPAVGLFGRAGTDRKPWRPTTAIVTAGPYRFTRNPMYVGMSLIYAGLAMAFDGPVALLLLPVVLVIIRVYVIAREESYLAAKFGETYLDYKSRVRRWF
jgi:protein-S-isoprenylcysteine O-methyltransferase Ste14